ncbi:MAG: nitrate reductase cytochrome c-type subunit [Bacteroidales bacterium]|nr:nitrate reductase cytochrome c-type subunit [Bacteroidales bacterium]
MNKMWICAVIFSLLLAGCGNNNSEKYIADEDIDMSDALIMGDESVLTDMPEYTKIRSGESKTIDRSYENAPPLIPHRVGGFLPIKVEDNKCLRCHMPDKAPEFKATPLPKTHFTSYRPVVVEEDGKYRVDAMEGEVVEKDLGHFNGAMFNCSQCHVPQAEVTVDIPNNFDPDYRQSNGKSKSNLKDKMGEGVR